jgi:hypothetical protein
MELFLAKLTEKILYDETDHVVWRAQTKSPHVVSGKRIGSLTEIPHTLKMISQRSVQGL